MKLQIYSDLHNEFSRFEPATSDADVVILAGDIDLKSRGVKWANETFQCPVIYVCGNHEYYGGHIDHTSRKMKEAALPHVHVLENQGSDFGSGSFFGYHRVDGLQFDRRHPSCNPHCAGVDERFSCDKS